MTDASVAFLLDDLHELLINHAHLIKDNKKDLESLEKQLRDLKTFIRNTEKKRIKDDELIRNIRCAVYEAEDVIDAFVDAVQRSYFEALEFESSYLSKRAASIVFPKFWRSSWFSITGIGKKVKEVTQNLMSLMDGAHSLNIDDDGDKHENSKDLMVRQENVAGFKDEMNAVIGYLTEQTDELDVITMVGIPRSGKKTLARMIFDDSKIKYEFTTRIWVDVSSEFKERDILLTILSSFTAINEDVKGKSYEALTDQLISHLESEKFLIVLADMWSLNDWDSLRIALPKPGKVLITTCNEEVGRYTSNFRQPHKVRPLSESESWELLQLKVFGKTECPPKLETVGQLIAKQCEGLQSLVVFMAGILERNDLSYGDDIMARRIAWMETCRSISEYRSMKLYDILPTHMKLCFLYLAAFPYDLEIAAGELISMWIAEGFIAPQNGLTLEECAERYLEDLIRINLVMCARFKANGKVKTCRINRMLHDFCKKEAGKEGEDLLTEIKFIDGEFYPPISRLSYHHRLSIHSNISDFFSHKPFCPRTRSLFVFSKDEVCLSQEIISSIPTAFKLLRVLNAKQIQFTHIASDIGELLHLRYLALSSNLSVLPVYFSNFWNIQTLIVNTTSPTLDIKPNILKFTKLRHFRTNASANLCKVDTAHDGGVKLQSLATISPKSCTKETFSRASNLKKLGICGKLSLLLDKKIESFENLAALGNLENLKLVNDAYPNPPSEGRLHSLPPYNDFPPTLKSLTLVATYLEWSQIRILEHLENLEVLKLKEMAFVGESWITCDGCFRSLKALHIAETNLSTWVASASYFPELRRLKLRNCDQLKNVPIELADIASLQLLDLYETKLAADSARRFLVEKQSLLKERSMDTEDFTLSIYPLSSYEQEDLQGDTHATCHVEGEIEPCQGEGIDVEVNQLHQIEIHTVDKEDRRAKRDIKHCGSRKKIINVPRCRRRSGLRVIRLQQAQAKRQSKVHLHQTRSQSAHLHTSRQHGPRLDLGATSIHPRVS
ncbi:putative late blight resistance protein homolog R1A-3 [Salvia splendens]|uniref:putative late blight resistance protein homolog R1A-3 n=1 Tax=Salvia splendens TaxID=180675 RepID=UPI001C26A987|nr:putative late blight resistance protein homolog R1A-3 [Salvia splendens]